MIPLSFLRRLDSLKYTSIIALTSIGYLVILVLAHFFRGDTMANRGTLRVVQPESAVAFLSSFPVIVFAYTCHQNVGVLPCGLLARTHDCIQMFSILNEISNNSQFRTFAVVVASIGTAAFLYILVAITGYLSFGNVVGGNVVAMCSSRRVGKLSFKLMCRRCTVNFFDNWKSSYRHPCHVFISPSSSSLSCIRRRSTEMAPAKKDRFERLSKQV